MPTYEYECEKCGKTFEMFQSITAEPVKTCIDETCKGPVHRLLSGGAGFLFKGQGFYVTDYRSESYKKAAQAEKTAGGSSSSTGESKPKGDGGSSPSFAADSKGGGGSSAASSRKTGSP
jgi:putative FmdB family regulatory protein